MSKQENKYSHVDVCDKVMGKIKKENVKIKHPIRILAEKISMGSIVFLNVLAGSLIVSIILYFLKKTGAIQFLYFGTSGIKAILTSLPYDFIALLVISIFLANYLLKKLYSRSNSIFFSNLSIVLLFITVLFIGSSFAVMGVENAVKNWVKFEIENENMVYGKIIKISDKSLLIIDSLGRETNVVIEKKEIFPYKNDYAEGRFIRAIGEKIGENYFLAKEIKCCDPD